MNEELSQPVHEIEAEQYKIPMRDGTRLDATIWRPVGSGRHPVIVERMAYEPIKRCSVNAEYFARHGYAFVGQNVRGTWASEGAYGCGRDDAWGANRDGVLG